jgi:Zn-dependent oligopeptidase
MDFYNKPQSRLTVAGQTVKRIQSNMESLKWVQDTILDLQVCYNEYDQLIEVNKKLINKMEAYKELIYINELLHDQIKSLNNEIKMLKSKDTPKVFHPDMYYRED